MNSDSQLQTTRRALHGVAELVLAGPQHAATGEIALRVTPGGFATTAGPDIRVEGTEVHGPGGSAAIAGHTPATLAAAVGVEARTLDQVYSGGPGVDTGELLTVDADAAARVADALAVGDAALRRLAPDEPVVLWPEHFDVAITVAEVNYGVSPGDGFLAVPYAYVGPWAVPAADDFWDAPFGAARPISELGDADAVLGFFLEGRDRLGGAPD
jgi:hypothetical protein